MKYSFVVLDFVFDRCGNKPRCQLVTLLVPVSGSGV
jgi:hypothetical protein